MIINEAFATQIRALRACEEGIEYALNYANTDEFWTNCPNVMYMLYWIGVCGVPNSDKLQEFGQRLITDNDVDSPAISRINDPHSPNDLLGGVTVYLEQIGVSPAHANLLRQYYDTDIPDTASLPS